MSDYAGRHSLVLQRVRALQPCSIDACAGGLTLPISTIGTLLEDLIRVAQIERTDAGLFACSISARAGRPGATPWHVQAGDGEFHATEYLQIADILVRVTGRGRTHERACARCTGLSSLIRSDPVGWLQKLTQGRV